MILYLYENRIAPSPPDLRDIQKVNTKIQRSKASGAFFFTVYDKIPESAEPPHYFSFFQFSTQLGNPQLDLYSYQHVLNEVSINTETTASSLAPASKVTEF